MSNTIARGQITFSDVLLVQEKSEVLSTWITINGTELADTVGDNGSYKLTKDLADKYLTKASTIVYTYRNGTGQQIFIYANNGSPLIKYVYPGIGVGNLDTAFYLLREFLRDSGLFTEAESFDESFDWSTYAMLLTSYYAQEMAISVAVNDIAQKTSEDARNALTRFVSQTYNPFASRIQSQVDQKAEVFYSNTDPSSGWSADEKLQHEGDIWCNISTQTLSGVNPGTLAIYSGSEWRMGNVPMEIVDQIDGKADIYTSLSASVTPKDKDLLIPLSDFTYSGVTYKANRVYRYNAASSVWVEIRYTTADDFASFQDAVNASIKDLEDVVDNTIDYWFKTYNPTTSNAPASEWTTEQLKVQHLGDLFYNTDAGTVYRWIRTDNGGTYVYSWQQLRDDAASRALSLAQEAKDIADGKRRVFLATPQTSDTYDRGDLWLHATIGVWSNETLVAIVNKEAGTIVSPSHWEIASKYTDDTVAERAESKANSLTTIIGLFMDDDYISPPEKRALLNAYNNERDIKDTICATAANYGLDTTEVESYYDTYGDVIDYYCIYVKQLYDGRYNPYGWDDSIPIDNTHYPLSAIQDYYDAKAALQDEIDTAVSNSLDAKAAKSDVQYLTAALAKDETVITGGLVLSSFIGVKDSNGVQAAINASTAVDGFKYKPAFSAVGDHGRLMIAAGINGVTTAYSTAATRIFEDGTVITNRLNATEATITSATITKTQNPFVRISGSYSAVQVDNVYTSTLNTHMTVTLDWSVASSGRRMTLAGSVSITAPSGQYFFENGRKFKTLKTSYEITELLGWGTETSFLGWVIVSRTMFQTHHNTGGKMFNPIAFGKVTTTGVGTNASFLFENTVSLYKSDGVTKYTIDGTNEISVIREGVGRYVIRVPREWFPTDDDGDGIERYVYVDVVGYGTVIDGGGGSSAVKASVVNIRTESAAGSDGTIYKCCAITIDTADDATSNDGKFFFKIYNTYQWED